VLLYARSKGYWGVIEEEWKRLLGIMMISGMP
jgi:hypothetical protein